jgi:hypothetical protein
MDKMAKERGFKMEEGVRKSSAVTKYVTQVLARAGKDHRNVHLASTLLDDAVSRQTERVHLKGTITKDSLLTLLEVHLPTPSICVYCALLEGTSCIVSIVCHAPAIRIQPKPQPQALANRNLATRRNSYTLELANPRRQRPIYEACL